MIGKNEIDFDELEAGQVLQYEEKYHAAAVAKILNVNYEERDGENGNQYQTVEIEILHSIFGPFGEGETLTLGRTTNEKLQHYVSWKFKKPGAMTDYCNATKLEEHRSHMLEIKEKYRDD